MNSIQFPRRLPFWLLVVQVGTLLCVAGCASEVAYRFDTKKFCNESQEKCETSSLVQTKDGYVLSFVELDDQGIFLDNHPEKSQQRSVLNYLKDRKDLYVIVYVHGWHHSAALHDTNVASFRRRLADAKARLPDKSVVGIYVGWRGDSITIPYLNVLTFWERKNVSEEVGRNALVGFLLELESIKKNQTDRNALVLTGHSFGASVLYNAVHQTLLQRLIQSDGSTSPRDVRGFGDLVVLVNPAIEAMRYSPLYDASQAHARREGFDPMQPVRLIVAATPGDSAVKTAFRIGRWFSTRFERHRIYEPPQHRRRTSPLQVDQAEIDRISMGQFEPYQTHWLGMTHRREERECKVAPGWLREAVQRKETKDNQEGEERLKGEGWTTKDERREWNLLGQDGIPKQLRIDHIVGRSHPFSPYWVVKLSESTIIKDHNNISGPNFWCFVDLVLLKESAAISAIAPPLPEPTHAPMSEKTEMD
ncbi:MAG: hypothetical protein H0W40_02430 [Methylibium sp.]|uniref:hypothetical protein n=1 Tax=Methylibium sp. TaxID=2067992 RepID=UPI0017F96005|nr:hypothetical protein [Methylibium sp.]MBA3596221.1 hypothetical protein [Methylibium sp.]